MVGVIVILDPVVVLKPLPVDGLADQLKLTKEGSLLTAPFKVKLPFAQIVVGATYSRNDLAQLWNYSGIQALARGVVTPRADNKIILFVTREKQSDHEHSPLSEI